MQQLKHSRLLPTIGLLLGSLVWLANNGNPPAGRTGAPFDTNCNNCHTGGNYNGTIEVTGFPTTADPGITYDINIKITATSGSPVKAGFEVVVVDNNNANCGDLINVTGGGTGTAMFSTREYIKHANGKNFSGGVVSWDFQWKAPNSVPGNTVKVYYIANFCNGNGGSGGDNPEWSNLSFSFSGPPPLAASISNTVNPTCNGANNGSATVEATGGTTPYTYLWTGGQTTQTAVNLTAGTYTCTVTGAGGSGTATASTTLTQPTALTLSTSVSGTVTCVNVATATATAGGGTQPYSYLWSDGQTGNMATFNQTGTYSVVATDANGCTKAATVNITGNTTPPVANAGPDGELTCNILSTQLNGAGSSVGTAFTYLWTTSNGNIVSGATTLTPTVNACGTYVLTVTNNTNGCTASATALVTCNTAQPNASATGGNLTCAAPLLTLMGNSTTPGVSYRWTGPGITPDNQNLQNPQVGATGLYVLTVTDPENGCTKTASATVTGNIVAPTAIGSVSGTLTCSTTSVQLNLTTNAPNPSFRWTGPNGFNANIANPSVSAPGDYYGEVTNPANGCKGYDTVTVMQNVVPPGASAAAPEQLTCADSMAQLLGNSPAVPNVSFAWTGDNFSSVEQNPNTDRAGVYTLTVTGLANGCTSTAIATVTENRVAPFDSIVPPANLNCNNASIQLNATPSSQGPDFDYLWKAKNGGHIVSGDTTLTPVVDSMGAYLLTITNVANGCKSTDSVWVNLSPQVTAAISAFVDVSCNGGSNGTATVSGGGGNNVYSYAWSNGASTASVSGLAAGTYFASVTDGENCSASVSVLIGQPDVLNANAAATGESALGANNGTATANPNGGTPGYTYQWSNGGTTQTINNLTPGSYTVVVLDANGCSAVQTVTVNAFGCSLLAAIESTNVTCNGASNGTATADVSGAAAPVSYTWSTGAVTPTVGGLAPGIYQVSIVDANNCPAVLVATIAEPPVLLANASATNVTANGATDGTATAAPAGGTPDYQYNWSTGATTQSISNLAPGAYTVVVTDANGCIDVQTVSVSGFDCAILATVSAAEPLCFGGNDGQATAAVSGGILPYTYIWSNNSTNQTITGLTAGTYTVSTTDAAGCLAIQTVQIGQPQQLNAIAVNVQNVPCPDDATGSAEIVVNGGIAPYTFNWPGGNVGNLGVGNYTVSVTDANGCNTTASFQISATDNQAPLLVCPPDIQICGPDFVSYGAPSVSDNCGVEVPPTVISGQPSGSVFDEGTHVIVYRATDVSGNSGTCSFAIVVNPVLDILIDNTANDLNNQGVGAIQVTIVGPQVAQYNWSLNGQPFANTEDLSGLHAGTYTLVVTDINGCTSALAPIVITNTVGVHDITEGTAKVWPNPATNAIWLEIKDMDVISYTIVDLRGALLLTSPRVETRQEIALDGLPEGTYCLLLQTADGKMLKLTFVKI